MNRDEFYTLLDQAGHRLSSLAKNSPGYAIEQYDLIALVEGKYQLFGYYWQEEDYDYSDGRMCSGVYFGKLDEVSNGEDMIPVYIKKNETN